ncbi:hypothetical protein MKQ68_21650 [Chitinophaga horti]|uniref:DUF7674 domain-containing protein n=1 Tax=Chitinophaga horti TaxID=2920382 RepID=A0ABY6J3C3_9BACT|nr:hypothetical protein [Chitinophaga horti]UYQ92687.1 hypothetical protein MKQ68_21650 [Chitinophaga horti]
MINQFEVPAMIEDALPELSKPLRQFPAVFHIYETMSCFTVYTCRQVTRGDFALAGRCLQLAGRLYERGNEKVKYAIEQYFMPVVSALPVKDAAQRIKLYSIIPSHLYRMFIHQQLKLS